MSRLIIIAMLIFIAGNIKAQENMNMKTRQQCLVTIGAQGAKGDIAALDGAIDAALDNVLTVNEIKEALSQLYAYAGFPRSLNALSTLQTVMKRRDVEHREYETGREATSLPEGYNALAEGTRVQTQLSGAPFNYSFVPATDYYLKAHLFGDIFSSDVLSYAERELVTLGAISALPGCESQLLSHARGALNMGVTRDELAAVPACLESNVGKAEASRARKAVSTALGQSAGESADEPELLFAKGEPNTAYARYFIGNSYLAPLANGEGKLPVSNVTFEPGCRNNWHIHHKGGQILICVDGEGWYQEWGKPARKLKAGDVVDIPAEVKHWHGATRDSWFQHIAISVPAEGASNTWLEEVTDEDYNKLK